MAEEIKDEVQEQEVSLEEQKEQELNEDNELSNDIAVVLFNEITQGYREWEYDDKKYRTRFATPKEDADARIAYAQSFNRALTQDLPSQKQMRKTLQEKGIWTEDDERELNEMRQKIEHLELILSKKNPKDNSKTTRKLAAELLELRSKAIEFSAQFNEFMSNTIESIAEEEKQAFYISTCTETDTGEKVWKTPLDFMNSRETGMFQSATYEYVTFTNGLAENYIEMLPEVAFMKAGRDDDD